MMHPLELWAIRKKVNRKNLCHLIGCSNPMLTNWYRGRNLPRAEYMVRIEEVTAGEVRPDHLVKFVNAKRSKP